MARVAAQRPAPQADSKRPKRGSAATPLPAPPEFKFLNEKPKRRIPPKAWLAGAAIAAAITAAVVILATSGSHGSPSNAANRANASRHGGAGSAAGRASGPGTAEVSRAALHVDVLNSTEINGLAHRVSSTLQEHGFSRAQALPGHPAGTYTTSVVEYAPGYRSSAERVARALGIEANGVRPLDAATRALAPGAAVVVVAAGSEPSGGSSSGGSSSGGSSSGGSPEAGGGGTPSGAGGGAEGNAAPSPSGGGTPGTAGGAGGEGAGGGTVGGAPPEGGVQNGTSAPGQ